MTHKSADTVAASLDEARRLIASIRWVYRPPSGGVFGDQPVPPQDDAGSRRARFEVIEGGRSD